MRFIDLFAGIGGFHLGIVRANPQAKCVWWCEIDKWARAIYEYHFGGIPNEADATTVDTSSIPDFDLLCAGFPCQSFSLAGNRQGFDDTRGTLFFEICRIARAKKPRFLLLENVKGLLYNRKGETFTVILQSLQELGYSLEWMVLNSRYFGVPQNRERIFIIGYLGTITTPTVFPDREGKEIFRTHNQERQVDRTVIQAPVSTTITANYSRGVYAKGETYVIDPKGQQGEVRIYKDIVPCLTRKMGLGGYNIPLLFRNPMRRLTPLECERLQGFPDNWTSKGVINGRVVTISDTQRYRLIGNAVTVPVVEAIANKSGIL